MPSSVRSGGQRAAVRARAEAAPQSLGLEEELSFGSDEDLMETIGEIDVPTAPPANQNLAGLKNAQANASTNSLKRTAGKSSKASTLSLRGHKHKVTENSLASSTHLLPPLPPVPAGSTLDLPSEMFGNRDHREDGSTGSQKHKRGSIMGTFKVKSLRKWRDDHSSKSSFLSNDSHSPQTSTLSLAKMGSNTSSRPSLASSYAQTPVTPASTAPQLAHLNLSHSSFEPPSKGSGYPNGHLHDIYGKQQPRYEPSLGNSSVTTDSSALVETPPVTAAKVRASSSWYRSELSTAILPEFPASSSQLQPITVLAVSASFRQVTATFNGLRQSRWVPCTLIFTRFKMSVDEKPRHGGANEHSVAHIHVLSAPAPQQRGMSNINSIGSMRRPSKTSSSTYMPVENGSSRQEIERRLLTRFSSAEITRDYAHSEGRDLALRVLFGDSMDGSKASGEWQLEIKDMSQLKESVNQIKKTAIMINAEELGYGHAIRDAFEAPSVSADELAQKLSIHARAVAARRDRKMTETAPEPPTRAPEPPSESLGRIKLQDSPSSSASQELGRRDSVDAAQGAAIPRSRSAEEVRSPPPTAAPLPIIEDALNAPDEREDSKRLSIGSTGTGAFTLASALAFPTPPSDLPPLRPVRALPLQPVLQQQQQQQQQRIQQHHLQQQQMQQHYQLQQQQAIQPTLAVNIVAPAPEDESGTATPMGRPPTPPRARSPSMSSSKRTLMAHSSSKGTPSVSSNNSGSSTSKLRRLRGKPQVIDVMAEFSAMEAEHTPPAEEEEAEPIREDRARRIRFAQE